MAVKGIAGSSAVGVLGSAAAVMDSAASQSEAAGFAALVKQMQAKSALALGETTGENTGSVSSSQIARNHRLTGDYTQGFAGTFTAEADKRAAPQGFARDSRTRTGSVPVIDKTSELYEQSMELENYFVKAVLSAMRSTVHKTSFVGKDNEAARKMYDDMMWDNVSEAVTRSSSLGLADQIYIELSGQR